MSKTKIIILHLIALAVFLLDRCLKYYLLKSPQTSRDFILFKVELWQNRGTAFGLGSHSSWLPPVIALLAIAVIILLASELIKQYKKRNYPAALLITLIILGAASNLLDRLLLGQVTDYISFNFWPVFNLADVMITTGVVGLVISLLLSKKQNNLKF